MSNENANLIQYIIKIKETLPKKQERLCNYILENHQDIGILTVKELADSAQVGTTTVMRLTKSLGYENFVDFKKQIYQMQTNNLNRWESVKGSFERDARESNISQLHWIIQKSLDNVSQILSPQLIAEFEKATKLLINSERIHVFGARPYKAAAIYFEVLINEFSNKINQLSYDSETLFDRVPFFKSDEVLMVLSFEPYTKRTLSLVDLAASKNIPIILLTNQLSCPAAKNADCILQVPTETEFFSIVPLIVLLEAIVVEIGRNSDNAIRNIEKLVPILKEYDVI